MTPRETIASLAQILETLPDFSEDDVYAAMRAAGIADADADRAYKFTQIACGRLILAGVVGRFSNDYFWLNAAGEVVESGDLRQEPHFTAAETLVRQRARPWVGRLGAMSADVAAINDLLTRGSRPGNLQTGPVVLFLENPTPAGMKKANRLIGDQLRAAAPAARKPWWRFW